MIKESIPLSMTEATDYIHSKTDSGAIVMGFVKKFIKISPKDAKELRRKIEAFGLMRVKGEHIAKIIDLLPETAEELNKIFIDMSLDEDEIKRILDTIKEFK